MGQRRADASRGDALCAVSQGASAETQRHSSAGNLQAKDISGAAVAGLG
jgi:queuine/archaeosine tRNA-ribosyltransferase